MTHLDRRQFILATLRAALATAATGTVPTLWLPRPALAAPPGPLVALRKGANIPQLVDEVLAALGGMKNFVKAGETVVVKPNIGWDRPVELAANTHPLVVRRVIEHCLEAGAKRIQVFDRSSNDPRRCYVASGIQEAVEGLGSKRVSIEHMERRAYQDLDIGQGVELTRWSFYQPALEADRFINLPIAKHHSISRLTLGMKNVMGVIGGDRGMLHRRLDEALSDINSVVHSDLTLIDATRILVANGPQGGRLEDVRQSETLVASADIVAADALATTLFNLKPEEISILVTAARRGLGVMDLGKVRRV